MTKYMMTGHLGLIGTALEKRLKQSGWECTGAFDIRDKSQLDYRWERDDRTADVLFDLGAFCKINKCVEDPDLAFGNNIAIFNSLEFCRKMKIPKIVFFSSSRVLSEEMNPYTESKRYGENLCKAYQKCYGLDYLIIRPSTVYGGEDKTNRLMNIWLNNAIKGEDLHLYGKETKTLDFTYIDDFLDAFFLVIDEKNKEYNIGGNEERLENVAAEIIIQTGTNGRIYYDDPETQQPQNVKIDISPLEMMGYKPKVNIKEGIGRELCRLTS